MLITTIRAMTTATSSNCVRIERTQDGNPECATMILRVSVNPPQMKRKPASAKRSLRPGLSIITTIISNRPSRAAKTTTVAAFTRKRPSRQPFPAHLPRERVVVPGPTFPGEAGFFQVGATFFFEPSGWLCSPTTHRESSLSGSSEEPIRMPNPPLRPRSRRYRANTSSACA